MPIENELFHTALIRSGFETLHGREQAQIIISQIVLNSQISYSHCIATLHARLCLQSPFSRRSPHFFTVIWAKGIPR